MASIRRPSRTSVSQTPWAPTATTGGIASAPIVLYGCQRCAASIALICSGVSPGVCAAITDQSRARAGDEAERSDEEERHHGSGLQSLKSRASGSIEATMASPQQFDDPSPSHHDDSPPRVLRLRLVPWDVASLLALLVLLAVLAFGTDWYAR